MVDDDRASNFLAQVLLEDIGLSGNVHTFTKGKDALNFINASLPDQDSQKAKDSHHIIFLDINMPEMSGFEFIKKLQTLPQVNTASLSVIMLSASSYHKDVETARELGVRKFLEKPLVEESLTAVLADILE